MLQTSLRGAVAGAVATVVMTLEQPLDKRLFDSEYDDVEILGRRAICASCGVSRPQIPGDLRSDRDRICFHRRRIQSTERTTSIPRPTTR